MATTISGPTVTDDSGTPASPVGDGTLFDSAFFSSFYSAINAMWSGATHVFSGTLSVQGQGPHKFSNGAGGANRVEVEHSSAGTANLAGLDLAVDAGTMGRFDAYSSTFTESSVKKQQGIAVRAMGAGGLSLAAENASGDVRLYANGTTKIATFDGDGIAFEGGSLGTWRTAGVPNGSVNTTKVGTDANKTEKDLHSYTLPGGSLAVDGQMIRYTAWGETGANTDKKTLRAYFGSTAVINTGAQNMNTGRWRIVMTVVRTGATTQEGFVAKNVSVATGGNWGGGVELHKTIGQTLASDVVIKVTGQNAASTADDVTCEGSFVEFLG